MKLVPVENGEATAFPAFASIKGPPENRHSYAVSNHQRGCCTQLPTCENTQKQQRYSDAVNHVFCSAEQVVDNLNRC